jgi:hypothetical protein
MWQAFLKKLSLGKLFLSILANPVSTVEFIDQYGFRPTGSTTAAITATLD